MCYEEKFFRSWATKKTQKRQENKPVTDRDQPQPMPNHPAPAPEVKRGKEVERELEQIV